MNKDTIKTIAKATGCLRFYSSLRQWKDNISSDKFECGIGDILLLRNVPSENQLLLTSRLLDVEAYLSGENQSFPFQNTISYADYGEKHREEVGNRSFKRLIESYIKEGYHSDSYITCDEDMNLMDGNHRMGLHIYERIERVNVKRVHRLVPFQYGGDWFYDKGLKAEFMEKIYLRFEGVQKWLIESGNTFCAYLKGENVFMNDAVSVFSRLCTVLNVIDLKDNRRLIQFSMSSPQYSFKDGKLYALRVQTIKRILEKQFAGEEIDISYNCLEGKTLFNKHH